MKENGLGGEQQTHSMHAVKEKYRSRHINKRTYLTRLCHRRVGNSWVKHHCGARPSLLISPSDTPFWLAIPNNTFKKTNRLHNSSLLFLINHSQQEAALTFIVASSEAETITLKTGWKITRVTGLRWPLSAYRSGGRGIHSLGSRFWLTGPPRVISSLASFSFDSSSITCHRHSGWNKSVKSTEGTQQE